MLQALEQVILNIKKTIQWSIVFLCHNQPLYRNNEKRRNLAKELVDYYRFLKLLWIKEVCVIYLSLVNTIHLLHSHVNDFTLINVIIYIQCKTFIHS